MAKYSPTYQCWVDVRRRCNNPKHPDFSLYGGRGITVCDRWDVFANFLEDMGERPDGRSLDRIDNNGHYSKENCRWATIYEQNRNTRKNIFFSFDGITLCKRDWEKRLGLSVGAISHRLERGWDIATAFTTPARPK